jgi:uncharacterized membrane protein YgdD (TMEM256/DUF423 family)
MDRAFLLLGSLLAFLGVALGAFGSHALRARLTPERLATFDTGVRYQLWHSLALFAVVLVGRFHFRVPSPTFELVTAGGGMGWPTVVAGWLFVAGIVLFSGSLYALALTGRRRWGAIAPFGGLCFLLGWVALALAAITI